jgi:filamentous hemagglutinin family protein
MKIKLARSIYWKLAISICLCLFECDRINAQITPDQTLPDNSIVTPESDRTVIDGGTTLGNNLLHSFQEFSVPTGTEAYFNNDNSIANILSRVTGSSISNIDGLIRANGQANLFLLNPNGIIFGANATLDIGGSFVGSTANSIVFEDNSQFSAIAPNESILTVSVPIGLNMGNNAKSILLQGDGKGIRTNTNEIDTTSGIRVQPDRTLALIGGDLKLEGATLKTAGGRIELGSVAAPGLVKIESIDKSITFNYQEISNFGNIQLSDSAAVDASGDGGGNIQVQGRKVKLEGGAQIEASTLGAKEGGSLKINASEEIELVGVIELSGTNTGLFTTVYRGAKGNGGNLKIETGHLRVRDDARISAGTSGIGNAGSVEILARDSVEIARKSTANPGSSITAVSGTRATGNGGNLTVETEKLLLKDGGVLSVGAFNQGDGGNLFVKAKDSIEIVGESLQGNSPSRISARTEGSGKSGNLFIETDRLSVRDGAKVTVSSEEIGSGDAGSLEIKANSLQLERQGSITAATDSGNGGNISVNADTIQLSKDAALTATAGNNGDGGNIDIKTDILTLIDNSKIAADATLGTGGNININASTGVFRSPDSQIAASSQLGIDGTVEINTEPTFQQFLNLNTPELTNTKEIIANSCLTNNYAKKLKFFIGGNGAVPINPDSGIDDGETSFKNPNHANVSPIASDGETILYSSEQVPNWRSDSPAIETNTLIRTADGKILGGRKMNLEEFDSLQCS